MNGVEKYFMDNQEHQSSLNDLQKFVTMLIRDIHTRTHTHTHTKLPTNHQPDCNYNVTLYCEIWNIMVSKIGTTSLPRGTDSRAIPLRGMHIVSVCNIFSFACLSILENLFHLRMKNGLS